MKKLLYLIPLFIFLFLISPNEVFGANYIHFVYKESGLTEEQKQEYLDRIFADSTFIENQKLYPYYMIVYNKQSSTPFQMNYVNVIGIMFFDSIPTFTNEISIGRTALENNMNNASKYYFYHCSDFSINTNSLYRLYLTNFKDQIELSNGDKIANYNYYIDFVLATNFSYSLGVDLDIYDLEDNLIKIINADENIFDGVKIENEVIYTIEDIEKADNTLYNLSVELLGKLPEEFTFLYSICQLFLGIIIILVVLSPIILLLRLFR